MTKRKIKDKEERKQTDESGAGRSLRNWLLIIVNTLILIIAFDVFGTKGLIGYLIFVAVWGVWRVYVARDQVMSMIRYLETIIYGKPLDKELWKKDEFKNRRKIKIVWRRKKKNVGKTDQEMEKC